MPDAYLIATSQGNILSISGQSRASQVRPILQNLLETSGAPARQIQEIHWHGGDQEFWLTSLGRSSGASTEPALQFAPEMARFQWPAVALLAHTALQSIARALEAGDSNLVLLAQETGDQVTALLLASSEAVELHKLSPRLRLGKKLALSSTPDGLLKAAHAAFDANSHGQDGSGQSPDGIQWLTAARRFEKAEEEAVFPSARWLERDKRAPTGDLFLFCALADRLEAEKAQRGLLLSEGPQKSGLATLVERV